MPENVSLVRNRTDVGQGRVWGGGVVARPAWVVTLLAGVLIFTSVVDVLGNVLVIISVLRNRKLRNAAWRR
ncbi:hypothetical protein DNTS_021641 [Danionella cerebrum]|uniref:G-protein coupled receptors family 1 profile domain-containing protein n=1 Tax=Danionella cerebrum TaxID=2873325 RepID=A0A553N5Z6_9TELE|nr:hypothetical protein DNTS_021641 [Danionella translucida]